MHKPSRERYVATLPLWLRIQLDPITRLGYPNYYRHSDICFVHVPKNAGTSVAVALYGRKIDHLSAAFLRKANPQLFRQSLKIAILRDPAERLVSAYNFIRTKGTKLVPIVDKPEFHEVDFLDFDRFLGEWLNRYMDQQIDPVFHRQSDYVCDAQGLVLLDQLYLSSNLQPLEKLLTQRTGTPVFIPRLNVSAEYSLELAPETRQKLVQALKRHYQRDLELFAELGGQSRLMAAP